MYSYQLFALFLARTDQTPLSALPGAPIVLEREKHGCLTWNSMLGHLATALHRAAWAIEPTRKVRSGC